MGALGPSSEAYKSEKGGEKWRTSGRIERRVPEIRWEVLNDEGKKEEYAERTRQLLVENERDVSRGEWKKVSEVMLRAVRDVCDVSERRVSNPWVIGHEEEIYEINARVNEAVNERNDCMTALNARRRLGTNVRRGVVRTTALENKLSVARTG